MDAPTIPLAEWMSTAISWCQLHGAGIFGVITAALSWLDDLIRAGLDAVPPIVIMMVASLWIASRRRYFAALMTFVALAFIWDLQLWPQAMDTVSLMVMACGISVLIGFPIGILIAEFELARKIITPILDYMQTTPAFVYLIPAVLFFGVGTAPGVLATAIFAAPVMARAVALGISEVKYSLTEAAEAFGASKFEILWKVKLPLSRNYIAIGVNQCIMMALSMVVICALIGARGLGVEVVTSLSQMDLPHGIEAGISVVLLAIALDQLCKTKNRQRLE